MDDDKFIAIKKKEAGQKNYMKQWAEGINEDDIEEFEGDLEDD